MRKTSAIAAVLFLCMSVLSGCQKTSGEVPETAAGVVPEEAAGIETQDRYSYKEDTSDPVQKLGERLGIEDTYSVSLKSSDQKIFLTAENVKVEYPDEKKVPIYEMNVKRLDQEFVDQVTDVLFGDAPVYFDFDYETRTKAEIMEEIEFLKESIQNGNMNPYGYRRNSDDADDFDIHKYMGKLESEYEEAPEEYTHKVIKPTTNAAENGYELPDDQKDLFQDKFFGYAVVDEEHVYHYELVNYADTGGSNSITVYLDYRSGDGYQYGGWNALTCEILEMPGDEWINYWLRRHNVKNFEKEVGISLEEAEKQADALVESLGIEGMERSQWYPAVRYGNTIKDYEDLGYEFHYKRNLNGISALYTAESISDLYSGEEITVVISENGMEVVDINNLYENGDIKQENPVLLSYDEVIKIMEDTLMAQDTESGGEEDYEKHIQVEGVTLSYLSVEAGYGKYLLLPVWNFPGRQWDNKYDEDEKNCGSVLYPTPLVIINAMDGTIVDWRL